MKVKRSARELTERFLAGEGLSIPLFSPHMDPDGIDDISIDIPESPTTSNTSDLEMSVKPKINFVDGTTVKGGYLGWASYDKGEIDIPKYDPIMRNANERMKPLYERTRTAIQRYTANHEIGELVYQPQNEHAHGIMEAENMQILESADPDAYMAGLALHKMRLKDGDKKGKEFSETTSNNYDLGKAFDRYGAGLDEWVGLVSDVITGKPTYSHYAAAASDNTRKISDYRTQGLREAA
jgi:hypothetical protein